mmetsp:Transcript_142586/g.455077  ORF Transcript_142586/g.455077 Transcript_142586/m.455077 type:complete len:162 (-) Transcript_142586:55-540(-)
MQGAMRSKTKSPATGSAPDPLQGRRRAKRGRQGASHDAFDLEALVVHTARFSLQTAAVTRGFSGAVEHSVLLPAKAQPTLDMQATGQMYSDAKKKKSQECPGAPHQYVWAALSKALASEERVSEADRRAILAHIQNTRSPDQLHSLVNVCMIRRTFDTPNL